ncbi:hypothetical protein C8F04DRAFT_1269404 [Mycena alexandri]|uniref:Uncharacterized protein n=1 Tax=Mycena alexandri TaxID=1745969 RepID=A0AAD6SDK6_9AGAR|nr:hypothetical protein C8F04DRAFT_1269404 [Mycena alexandri]
MARTKQTAPKSTGGPVPKKRLAPPAPDDGAFRSPAVIYRPAKKKRKVLEDTAADPILLTLPVAIALNPPPADANKWCTGCDDGGRMVPCDTCPRHLCGRCLEFPAAVDEPGHTFYCPKCWIQGNKAIPDWTVDDEAEADANPAEAAHNATLLIRRAGPHVPYRGVFKAGKPLAPLQYKGPQTLRGRWPLSDTTRLVVLSLRLDGTPLYGDAAALVANHLLPYYCDAPFCFETLTFDLNDGIFAYDAAVDVLADRLTAYDPDKIIVFLTDHSTPDEGNLHMSKGGTASNEANIILPRLMPPKLQQVVRQARISLLVLQVCGALNVGPARDQVAQFVSVAGFQHAIGFTAPHFLPAAANTFLQDIAHHFLVTGHAKKFHHILATHYELGMHTDVVMYFPTREIHRYCWTHPIHRPYGHRPPLQCRACHALSCFELSVYTEREIVLKCAACKENGVKKPLEVAFEAPQHLQRIDGKKWVGGKKDNALEGVWYGQWLLKNRQGNGLPVYQS